MTWETLAADVKATRKALDEALTSQEAARLACDRADREVEAAVAPPAIRAAHERFKKDVREAYARFSAAKHAAGFCTFGGCMSRAHPNSNRCAAHK